MDLFEAYIEKHQFIKVYCRCREIPLPIDTFLGYLQTDMPHMTKHYCKNCKKMHTFVVDANLVIHRQITKKLRFIDSYHEQAVIA